MTIFAACALAGAAIAADSNIVGYVTKTTSENLMDIVGVHFQNTDGTDINVQDVLPMSGFDYGVDLLRVWNAGSEKYTLAYYFTDTYADFDYDPDLGPGWADTDQIRCDFTIEAGQSFWLTTVHNASVTIAGEVLAKTDNKLSTKGNKMDLICNTFPVDANIQDVKPVSGFDYGVDLLRVWNAGLEKYTFAYYFTDTYADFDYDPDLGPGWADTDQIRCDFTIKAGQGFWLTTVSDAVVEFTPPAGI